MVRVLLPDGKVIIRKAFSKVLGNFCQLYIRYKNKKYAIGDGDEYLRGMPNVFRLNYCCEGSGKINYVNYERKN